MKSPNFYFEGKGSQFPVPVYNFTAVQRGADHLFLSPSLSFKLGLKHNVSQTKAITGMLLLTLGNTRFPLATGGCQLVTVMSVGLCDTGLIHFMLQWWSHIQNSGKANATWLKDTGLQKVSMPIDCIAWHTLHAIVNLNSAEETCLISSPFLIMLANTQSTNLCCLKTWIQFC